MNVYPGIIIRSIRNSAAKIQEAYEAPLLVGGDIKVEIAEALSYCPPGGLQGRMWSPWVGGVSPVTVDSACVARK